MPPAVSPADIGRMRRQRGPATRSSATSVSTGGATFLYDFAIAAEAIDVTGFALVSDEVFQGPAR